MRIAFVANHRKWGGLQNNGGTKTILKSASTLRELGHRVDIVATVDRFTWFKHVKPIPEIPADTDVAIAVSVSEINNVLKSNAKRKFWFCRGLERWRMQEGKIIKKAKKINIIVNSSWLLEKFPHAEVCFAGLDVDHWYDNRIHDWNRPKWTIGFLKHHKLASKRNDIMFDVLRYFKRNPVYRYKILDSNGNLNDYQMKEFYNECDMWVATSTLEGFHQCPAEAGLAGALIIYHDIDSGGTKDYCSPATGMPFKTVDEAIQRILNPDFRKVEVMQEVLREKIGNRRKNMKRLVELIS